MKEVLKNIWYGFRFCFISGLAVVGAVAVVLGPAFLADKYDVKFLWIYSIHVLGLMCLIGSLEESGY